MGLGHTYNSPSITNSDSEIGKKHTNCCVSKKTFEIYLNKDHAFEPSLVDFDNYLSKKYGRDKLRGENVFS